MLMEGRRGEGSWIVCVSHGQKGQKCLLFCIFCLGDRSFATDLSRQLSYRCMNVRLERGGCGDHLGAATGPSPMCTGGLNCEGMGLKGAGGWNLSPRGVPSGSSF